MQKLLWVDIHVIQLFFSLSVLSQSKVIDIFQNGNQIRHNILEHIYAP